MAMEEKKNYIEVNVCPNDVKTITMADSAVNAVAIILEDSWNNIYDCLVEQAHKMCYMPADLRCVHSLLKAKGFFQQPTKLTGITIHKVCEYMKETYEDGAMAIVKTPKYWYGGHMTAVVPIKKEDGTTSYVAKGIEYRNQYEIEEFWIRWPDGQDHSITPRRKGNNGTRKAKEREVEEHKYFHYYLANPDQHNIGDCVLRGLSAACQISWHEAMDELVKHTHYEGITINNWDAYPLVLKSKGFYEFSPLRRDGKMLTGQEFCEEMNRRYHSGERIFANVGSNHVAAILPFKEKNGETQYKIVDSWDSSKRKIGQYWVYCEKTSQPIAKKEATVKKELKYKVGDSIIHPKFGVGIIKNIVNPNQSAILEILFPKEGLKKLSAQWVTENAIQKS